MPEERDEQRRVYRAGSEDDGSRNRRTRSRREWERPAAQTGGRGNKRTPILAVIVLVVIAVVIILTGVAARDGGLAGSQGDTGSFKLLPITTTTTS